MLIHVSSRQLDRIAQLIGEISRADATPVHYDECERMMTFVVAEKFVDADAERARRPSRSP